MKNNSAPAPSQPLVDVVHHSPADHDIRLQPLHDDIAARAKKLWLEQGCPTGRDAALWEEAEGQVMQEAARKNGPAETK